MTPTRLRGWQPQSMGPTVFAALSRRASAVHPFADEAALARLLIGAAAIAPAERRQWVKHIP